MDQRVFGPYYGTPPHLRPDEFRTDAAVQQPTRQTLRQRLLTRRRRRTTPRP